MDLIHRLRDKEDRKAKALRVVVGMNSRRAQYMGKAKPLDLIEHEGNYFIGDPG